MIVLNIFVIVAAVTGVIVAGSPMATRSSKFDLVDNANDNDKTPLMQYNEIQESGEHLNSDENYPEDLEPNISPNEAKRSALRFAIARRSHSNKDEAVVSASTEGQRQVKYIPALSVGAVMNLRDFFRDFKSNLDTLSAVSPEQLRAVSSLSPRPPVESFRSVSKYVEDSSHIRPTANAAYLHAMRMYRPSHRIRALRVHHPEPYLGANNFNPQYLWTGLG